MNEYKDNAFHIEKSNIYSTHQIARFSGVCVNTVRNYEKYGFISKSIRANNNYRMFSDVHKLQMAICRLVFTPAYINSLIRKSSMEVIYASAKENFELCKEQTEKYIRIIENELSKANEAVTALSNFSKPKPKNMNLYYDRKEAADMIGTTVETIRNWERNGLLISTKKNRKSIYNQTELDFMRLIYILISGGFTIQKIYDALIFLRDAENKQAAKALCESYGYIQLEKIEENIIERIKAVLDSAYQIEELLKKIFRHKVCKENLTCYNTAAKIF